MFGKDKGNTVTSAKSIGNKDDFQIKYDLKSAFHNIKIHRSQHTKYLGACFNDDTGKKQYFVFLFLPFGLGSAVHCITKLLKPIVAHLHLKGIRNTIFIDDGRVLAITAEEAEKARKLAYQTLEKAGWTLESQKSDKEGEASKIKEYLGFVINTASMTVQLKEDRQADIKQQVLTLVQGTRPIHVKELAKALGKMVTTEPALGPMPLMAGRAAYIQLDKIVEEQGWNCNLILNTEARAGLKFLQKKCPFSITQ